jgi:hypothetical protein
MTFLEFVCQRLLGRPTHTEGGCPCWPCPRCGHRSWHVRPPSAVHKDRCSCWSCQWWGDEYDLLRQLFPGEMYPQRRARLEQYRAAYDREQEGNGVGARNGNGAAAADPAPTFLPRGRGFGGHAMNPYDREPAMDEFSPAADEAVAELLDGMGHLDPAARRAALRQCQLALSACARHQLHPDGLAARCGFVVWAEEGDERHRAECREPARCDDAPLQGGPRAAAPDAGRGPGRRAPRGWPPRPGAGGGGNGKGVNHAAG